MSTLLRAPITRQVKTKTSDQSVSNSTTVVDITDFEIDVGPNQTWTVQYMLHLTSATAGGARLNVSMPSGASGTIRIFIAHATSPGPGTGAFSTYGGAIGSDYTLDNSSTSDLHVGPVSITVTTGSVGGQVKLQFAQRATSGTATKVKAGAIAIADRVS